MLERRSPMIESDGAALSVISFVSSEIFPTEVKDSRMMPAITTSTAPKPARSLARRWFLNQDMRGGGSLEENGADLARSSPQSPGSWRLTGQSSDQCVVSDDLPVYVES